MAVHELEYVRSIVLPTAKGIHEVIEAFFRTSEQGSWAKDELTPSDLFVMNFCRGNWTTRRFSKERVPAEPSFGPHEATSVRTTAALAGVTIRPSPKDTVVTVRHRVYWPRVPSEEYSLPKQWEQHTMSELNALRAYLAEWYQLAELPPLLQA